MAYSDSKDELNNILAVENNEQKEEEIDEPIHSESFLESHDNEKNKDHTSGTQKIFRSDSFRDILCNSSIKKTESENILEKQMKSVDILCRNNTDYNKMVYKTLNPDVMIYENNNPEATLVEKYKEKMNPKT
jgi:hypothetical protein